MLPAVLLACATTVAPVTMQAVVNVESSGISTALHVNRWAGAQPQASTVNEAVKIAQQFIAAGYSVDLGLGQLNSRNLNRFSMTVEDAFNDCKNLAASGAVLSSFYGQAVGRFGEGQQALMAALSGYNTGDLSRGFQNGYVAKYYVGARLAPVVTSSAVMQATIRQKPWLKPWFETTAYVRPGYEVTLQ